MISIDEKVKIEIAGNAHIVIAYLPKTARAVFDICDVNGRILKTGLLNKTSTKVDIQDLDRTEQYVVLVLDGDRVHSTKFRP
jgi:hypothetical protein